LPGANPAVFLFSLIAIGAISAAILARRVERADPARLARGFLIAVAVLMGIRVAAWTAAHIFGVSAVRPLETGPYDATNLLIGALYGLAATRAIGASRASRASTSRGAGARLDDFLSAPELLLAMRVATGVAFVLAGLGAFLFTLRTGIDYFVQIGYPKTFHLFIMSAEVLGGALLLLPWRWLTLIAAAGLTIDMFGALYTQVRLDQPLDPAAFAMLLRLLPLAVLTVHARHRPAASLGRSRRTWIAVTIAALACAAAAIVGSQVLMLPSSR
jgi:hypothetical protein